MQGSRGAPHILGKTVKRDMAELGFEASDRHPWVYGQVCRGIAVVATHWRCSLCGGREGASLVARRFE